MAKKITAAEIARKLNTQPAVNADTEPRKAMALIDVETSDRITSLADKLGITSEDAMNKLLAFGLSIAVPASDIPSPAKAMEAATPSTDTGDAAKAAEASLWKLRNAEIDKARGNRNNSQYLDILEAMTPANGEWILAEMEETLDRMNLLDECGVVLALMTEFELYYVCFKSRSCFRQGLGELLTKDIKSSGFISKQARMAAMHLDEVAPGFFSRKKLLELGATIYHDFAD